MRLLIQLVQAQIIGEPQDFACEAAGDDQAEFFWTFGDRRLENSYDVGQSIASSSLLFIRITPTIQDSGSELKCWERDSYDVIKLSIFQQEILDASELDEDISTELSLDAIVFPPPKRTDFTWKIGGLDDDEEGLILHPGTENAERTLRALPIEEIEANTYRLTLDISQLGPEELRTLQFSILIQSETGGLVTHQFKRVKLRSLQDSTVASMQIPFWIWICVAVMVVVFAAIFAIIYLAVVRRQDTKPVLETRREGGNVYIRADSRDSP